MNYLAKILLIVGIICLLFVFTDTQENDRFLCRFGKFHILALVLCANLIMLGLHIIRTGYFSYNKLLTIDAVVLIIYSLYAIIYTYIRNSKINDAITFGIKGGEYTGAYQVDRDRLLVVKKHYFICGEYPSLGGTEYIKLPYTGVLDIYDGESLSYIRSVSEEELWGMIKKRKGETPVAHKTKFYRQYSILYSKLSYNAYWLQGHEEKFDDLMKRSVCPFCGKPSSEIKYAYIRFDKDDTSLMIYNTCCKKANKFIGQLINEVNGTDNIKS